MGSFVAYEQHYGYELHLRHKNRSVKQKLTYRVRNGSQSNRICVADQRVYHCLMLKRGLKKLMIDLLNANVVISWIENTPLSFNSEIQITY